MTRACSARYTRLAIACAVAAALTIASSALVAKPPLAANSASAETALLATSCSSCHASKHRQAIPSLYGRRAAKLEKYLLDYKTGKRKGTLMPRIARGYTSTQLKDLASYFSTASAPDA